MIFKKSFSDFLKIALLLSSSYLSNKTTYASSQEREEDYNTNLDERIEEDNMESPIYYGFKIFLFTYSIIIFAILYYIRDINERHKENEAKAKCKEKGLFLAFHVEVNKKHTDFRIDLDKNIALFESKYKLSTKQAKDKICKRITDAFENMKSQAIKKGFSKIHRWTEESIKDHEKDKKYLIEQYYKPNEIIEELGNEIIKSSNNSSEEMKVIIKSLLQKNSPKIHKLSEFIIQVFNFVYLRKEKISYNKIGSVLSVLLDICDEDRDTLNIVLNKRSSYLNNSIYAHYSKIEDTDSNILKILKSKGANTTDKKKDTTSLIYYWSMFLLNPWFFFVVIFIYKENLYFSRDIIKFIISLFSSKDNDTNLQAKEIDQ